MTDRERLLEQVIEAEQEAASSGRYCRAWADVARSDDEDETAGAQAERFAKQSAHHALTAMALRDVIDATDEAICPDGLWIDGERWR